MKTGLIEKGSTCHASEFGDKHPPSSGHGPCPTKKCIRKFAKICYEICNGKTTPCKVRAEMTPKERRLLDYTEKHITAVCNDCFTAFIDESSQLRSTEN